MLANRVFITFIFLFSKLFKKPSYSGNITSDGNAGLRILESTPLKDSVLQKCKAKTHSLDENYIILDNNNADCVLSTLTKQATT